MGVFRKRLGHREYPTILLFGSGSVVTASLASAAVAFGGTATGSTTATDGGTVTAAITFTATTVEEITLEVSGNNQITFGGSATGYGYTSRTAASAIVLGGTATAANTASGTIVFGGSASAAQGFFTAEVAAGITVAGSVDGALLGTGSGEITFGGTADATETEGGTLEGTASAEITFGGTAHPNALISPVTASGEVIFGGEATGIGVLREVDRIRVVPRPRWRIKVRQV